MRWIADAGHARRRRASARAASAAMYVSADGDPLVRKRKLQPESLSLSSVSKLAAPLPPDPAFSPPDPPEDGPDRVPPEPPALVPAFPPVLAPPVPPVLVTGMPLPGACRYRCIAQFDALHVTYSVTPWFEMGALTTLSSTGPDGFPTAAGAAAVPVSSSQ
jgi:hypothetical protein